MIYKISAMIFDLSGFLNLPRHRSRSFLQILILLASDVESGGVSDKESGDPISQCALTAPLTFINLIINLQNIISFTIS